MRPDEAENKARPDEAENKARPDKKANNLQADLLAGNRRALARAITLAESSRPDHRETAEALLAAVLPHTGNSIRIGISGAPGVGKSTFIESFGSYLIDQGKKVAVLAVDPSSRRSGGSILGDKTRMELLSRNPAAFIRPSPAGGTLGGVARRTREAMLLTEAAGFDVVIVETVGVGQSETAVADMVDFFVLLLSPGGGDELQGIKRGIMELADLVVVNKADGALEPAARMAATEHAGALQLMRPRLPQWTPLVLLASALQNTGNAEIWKAITDFNQIMAKDNALSERRAEQACRWMWEEIREKLMDSFTADKQVQKLATELEQAVADGRQTPSAAAARLLRAYQGV